MDKDRLKKIAEFFEQYDAGYRVDPFRKIHWKVVHDWLEHERTTLRLSEGADGSFRFGAVIKALKPGHRVRNFSRETVGVARPGDVECLAFAHDQDSDSRQGLISYLKSLGNVWFAHMNQENPASRNLLRDLGARHISARIGGVGAGEISGIHHFGNPDDFSPNPLDKVCFGLLGRFDPGGMAQRLLAMDFEVTDRGERYGGPKRTWTRVCVRDAGLPRGTAENHLLNHPVFSVAPDLLDVMRSVGPLNDFDYTMLTRTAATEGVISRHSDIALDAKTVQLGPKLGHTMRLHFVIQSNPGCVFHIWNDDGTRQSVVMQTGDIWYTDVRKPHSVENLGPTPRVHLVTDFYGDTSPWSRFQQVIPDIEWQASTDFDLMRALSE